MTQRLSLAINKKILKNNYYKYKVLQINFEVEFFNLTKSNLINISRD